MPRLPPSLFRHAHSIDSLLPLLLPVCRDLHSARNELHWLREHAISTATSTKPSQLQHRCQKLVVERAAGKPLQYVLGNQPFGELEILCKPGVLIPRPETEALSTHLTDLLSRSLYSLGNKRQKKNLYILDLCTGTGCIALLLHALLSRHFPHLCTLGIDNSTAAIALANKNKAHNIKLGHLQPIAAEQVRWRQDDIFASRPPKSNPASATRPSWPDEEWDILISNPPYISPRSFVTTTSKSVRDWEPKTALVPPGTFSGLVSDSEDARVGDSFYPRILDIANRVSAKVVLFEVADLAQAIRVVGMVAKRGEWDGCEIWRDWPGQGGVVEWEEVLVGGKGVNVQGEGHGRAVLAWREDGAQMLGKK